MKRFLFLLSAGLVLCWAEQSAPVAAPGGDPGEVIAIIDGEKLTAKEFYALLSVLPPQSQQIAMTNRQQFLEQYALFRKLAQMALENKLHEQDPYRQALAYNRDRLLAEAMIKAKSDEMPVTPEEQQQYYDTHQQRYDQAHVRMIYIAFYANPTSATPAESGKKPLSEEEAKAKAEEIVRRLRAGADFTEMVKQHSDDPQSRARNGDYGQPMKRSDNLPAAVIQTVFSLKEGEISDPVRMRNGFYIFRLDKLSRQSFAEVRDNIFMEVRDQKVKEWIEATQKAIKVELPPAVAAPASPQP